MATSLVRSEKDGSFAVYFYHFYFAKNLVKIGPVDPEIFVPKGTLK